MKKSILLISLAVLPLFGYSQNVLPDWALGGFVRPEKANPIITPNPSNQFDCPMQDKKIGWEESDVFNPAATVKDGKIYVLYRAEDNSATGIGKRTSRIGLAESEDGIHMKRRKTPVMYPDKDNMKEYEWEGGCEDPRVTMTEDGLYVMAYTSWNRKVARLCIATSHDLVKWEKHGPAFAKAYNGRFKDIFCKSGSMVTTIKDGKQVLTKIDGKYFMYWGEHAVYAATSDDLVNWTPILDEKNELATVIKPRPQYFDSALTECGPPAILTDKGIVLLYNGKNQTNDSKRRQAFHSRSLLCRTDSDRSEGTDEGSATSGRSFLPSDGFIRKERTVCRRNRLYRRFGLFQKQMVSLLRMCRFSGQRSYLRSGQENSWRSDPELKE